jgi:hypothetical protein
MNLHAIAGPVISAINPTQTVDIATGSGVTQAADFSVTPNYSIASFPAQIQALTGRELRHVDALNIQGTMRSLYLYGNVTGVLRFSQTNGSLVKFADGSIWMCFAEFEPWSVTAGWCKIGVMSQQASVWPG